MTELIDASVRTPEPELWKRFVSRGCAECNNDVDAINDEQEVNDNDHDDGEDGDDEEEEEDNGNKNETYFITMVACVC